MLLQLTGIPCAHNQPTAVRGPLDVLDKSRNLIHAASIRPPPVPPLSAIDSAKIAFFIGPFLPNRHVVLAEIVDVGVALEKPEQLMNDRTQMQSFWWSAGETISSRSNRSCAPKIEYVPVPVRSALNFPWSRTRRRRRWYCCMIPATRCHVLRDGCNSLSRIPGGLLQ